MIKYFTIEDLPKHYLQKKFHTLMPTVTYAIPYENAKEMLLVEEVDNKDFLANLFNAMYDELPTPKPKKKKQ